MIPYYVSLSFRWKPGALDDIQVHFSPRHVCECPESHRRWDFVTHYCGTCSKPYVIAWGAYPVTVRQDILVPLLTPYLWNEVKDGPYKGEEIHGFAMREDRWHHVECGLNQENEVASVYLVSPTLLWGELNDLERSDLRLKWLNKVKPASIPASTRITRTQILFGV